MRVVLAIGGIWLATLSIVLAVVVAFGRGPSIGATSCTRVVYQYLHAASQAVGVNLKHERLIACRQDGDESVARVEFDATIESVGQTVHEVLSLRLVKSPWSIADVHQVG